MADITGYPYGKLPGGWENDVLNSLQVPITVGNVHFLDSWEMFEQGNPAVAAQYNPFNTSQGGPGTTTIYSTLTGGGKIWNYKDWQSGLNATIATLTGSKSKQSHYDDIISQLQSGIRPGQDVISKGFASWGQYDDVNTATYPNLPSTSFNGAPKDDAIPVGSGSTTDSVGSSSNSNPSSSFLSISPWLIVAIVLVAIFVILK